MKYREIKGKYRYELTHSYCHELSFTVSEIRGNDWCGLFPRRALIVERLYQWDGVSFPCFPQSAHTARATLVHDSLTQLAKLGHCTRLQADREFKKVLIADGVSRLLAGFMFACVRAYALIKY